MRTYLTDTGLFTDMAIAAGEAGDFTGAALYTAALGEELTDEQAEETVDGRRIGDMDQKEAKALAIAAILEEATHCEVCRELGIWTLTWWNPILAGFTTVPGPRGDMMACDACSRRLGTARAQ